ncbi:GntR family transcriptional regulator [Lentibacillus kapialis]|uniref:GntR family transcriptional regulator n=1 Tax=Lentibacillus kapialis TaxID=340214 RepID=A0A917UZ55_9BACI|nr:GntR family transcriptional regulator [Lentibacillus kapialis]GGJ98480.1 GntR family transcriptional regulator [Lentibacillus kapialis]
MVSITTSSVTTQVTDAIRDAIIKGKYKPGEKLSEALLSEYYEVSRTPIREAFKRLSIEGLVEVKPRVGTRVTKPTEKELTELFAVKEVLEGLAAKLLAEKENNTGIEQLEHSIKRMEDALESSDYNIFVEANDNFHKFIRAESENSKLNFFLNSLLNQISYNRYVHLSIEQPNRLEESIMEHKRVLAAIKSSNPAEAEKYMREHVKASGQVLKKGVAKELYE